MSVARCQIVQSNPYLSSSYQLVQRKERGYDAGPPWVIMSLDQPGGACWLGRRLGLLLVALMTAEGCGPEVKSDVVNLRGGEMRMRALRPSISLHGGGEGMLLLYETQRPIEDHDALEKEIAEIWREFKWMPEGSHMGVVLMRATTKKQQGWEVVGDDFQMIYRRTRDGGWQSERDPDLSLVEEVAR